MPATSALTDDQIRHIREQCEALVISYARAIDFRDYDHFLELFTTDAQLDTGRPLKGLAAIRESLRHRPDELRSRHVMSNLFVDVLDAENARGIAYLTLYRHVGDDSVRFGPVPLDGPAAVGHYEDRYQRTAGGWRFAARKLQLAFRNPAKF
ncbi:MAG: nuclear transport factor 2 family protein [Pseudomonadales bacterium]